MYCHPPGGLMEPLANILVVLLELFFLFAFLGFSMVFSLLYMLAYTLIPLGILYFLLRDQKKTRTTPAEGH